MLLELALIVASATASSSVESAAPSPSGAWQVVDCPFPDEVTLDGRKLRNQLTPICGRLTVPENYDRPDGRTIVISAMVIKSRAARPKRDPVLFLSGGPGAYALPNWEYVIHEPLAVDIIGNRDWVILDQRGTGRSGALPCPGPRPTPEELAECRDGFIAKGIDLAQYNSLRVAQDVEALRKALDIEQWNLHGISYGSRVAHTVARHFPDSVRTMVLDAPMAPESDPALDDALGAERALSRLGERCSEQPACERAYPNVFQRFTEGLTYFERNPGRDEVFTLDNRVLFRFVKTHFESDEIMPFERRLGETLQMMDAIGRRDLLTVRRVVEAAEASASPPPADAPAAAAPAAPAPNRDYLLHAFGQKWSVDCNEEKPFESLAAWEEAGRTSVIVRSMKQDFLWRRDICRDWPSGTADSTENANVRIAIPQLVLSGEFDPSLSGTVGDRIARNSANARNIVFRNAWHGQMKTGDVFPGSPFNAYRMCAVKLMQAFRDDPFAPLETSCAKARTVALTPAAMARGAKGRQSPGS